MQSKVRNVRSYLEQVPDDRRKALKKLRQLCQQTLRGYEECMEYGAPAYKRDGVVEVAFASQKHCISLYVLTKDVLDRAPQGI